MDDFYLFIFVLWRIYIREKIVISFISCLINLANSSYVLFKLNVLEANRLGTMYYRNTVIYIDNWCHLIYSTLML